MKSGEGWEWGRLNSIFIFCLLLVTSTKICAAFYIVNITSVAKFPKNASHCVSYISYFYLLLVRKKNTAPLQDILFYSYFNSKTGKQNEYLRQYLQSSKLASCKTKCSYCSGIYLNFTTSIQMREYAHHLHFYKFHEKKPKV